MGDDSHLPSLFAQEEHLDEDIHVDVSEAAETHLVTTADVASAGDPSKSENLSPSWFAHKEHANEGTHDGMSGAPNSNLSTTADMASAVDLSNTQRTITTDDDGDDD